MSSANLPTTLPFQPVRMSVARYHALVAQGAYDENDRVELLDGIVVEKMPKNPRHVLVTRRIDIKLGAVIPPGFHVRNQEPITLSSSEPEPDIAVVRGALEHYVNGHPGPSDIGLVVEVAQTSLVTDRFKAELYAEAGIPVYWLVNLNEQTVEVYSAPDLDSETPHYRDVRVCSTDESLMLTVFDQECHAISIRELLD